MAGREAARAALSGHDDAGLLLVFASGGHDLRAVAAEISDVAAGIPIVGCSSAGEIDASGPASRSVVVLALGGEGLSFSATAVSGAEPRAAAGHADLVRGAYSVAGAGVPIVGGIAGHPTRGEPATVFYGGTVLTDAVIGIAIGSDAPLGVGVRHGWRPVGDPMLVTRAAPGRVVELDGRPAGEVYRERLGGDATDDRVLAHPLGLQRRIGEPHVRGVRLDNVFDGSIQAAVPAGAMVWLMESDADGVLGATDAACREAIEALDGHDPEALVIFDCAARLKFLGQDGAADEVARVVAHGGGTTVAGLYTDGEIARVRGVAGYHNQTLVILAIA